MIQDTYGDHSPGRILLLITTLTFGGAEMQVARLATELQARGWIVAVACLVEPNAHSAQLERRGIEVHSLGMRRGIPDPRALLRLRSLVRRFRPDVVHSHMFHANLFGRLARLLCWFPILICTAHNLRETSEKGGATWHKELLYRATDALADKTTIICRAAYDRYVRVGAVPARKFQVIPNGVDTEVFSPAPEARAAARSALNVDGCFVWLTVGRLVKQKDYPTLLRAFQKVKSNGSLLLIAGGGPLETELRLECKRLGLTGQVRFCGTNENILPLYHAADAFVLSSEFEGLSAALLEAAAMGLPVVATDVGGNREVVLDGITGSLVPPHDPESLAAAMQRLETAHTGERQSFGAAARQHCRANYPMDAVIRQWTDLYGAYVHRLPAHSLVTAQTVAVPRIHV